MMLVYSVLSCLLSRCTLLSSTPKKREEVHFSVPQSRLTGVRKKIEALAKQKQCEVVAKWQNSIIVPMCGINHMQTATATQ